MAAVSQTARSNAEFAVALFQKLNAADSGENIIVSPFSIRACMGMAFTGAKGQTAKEIADGMRYHSNSTSEVAKEFQSVFTNYNDGDTLRVANKMYIQEGNTTKADYASLAKAYYHAESETINFAESESAARTINEWVEAKTQGKITDLVSSDSIDGSCRLVLLNAIHFKGLWKDKFRQERTELADFWIDEETPVKLQFMRREGWMHFAYYEQFRSMAVELPYKDSDLSMFVVLPFERHGLKKLAKKLRDDNLPEMVNKLKFMPVDLRLPKFKIEYSVDVAKALQEMGINKAFNDEADFSNILEYSQGYHISSVIHRAVFEINEEGTEASAANRMPMASRIPPRFTADHPFFYWIWNRKSVLFAGVFANDPNRRARMP